MSDFNLGPKNTNIKSFCEDFDLTNLIKEPSYMLLALFLFFRTDYEAFKVLVLLKQVCLNFIRCYSLNSLFRNISIE